MQEAIQTFGAALTELLGELDWARLGRVYCEGDGSEFFDDERRERLLDIGLRIADELATALPQGGPRRSLYVGAAVAELAPILAERLVLGREVVWLNLPGEETDELARALRAVGERLGLALPAPSTDALATLPEAPFDHLWMVSVLTDPDAFPALHDELYERAGGPLATGRGELGEERERAKALAEALLARAAPEALLSTTDEELTVFEPLARRLGRALEVPKTSRLTAVVGDRLRYCSLGGRRGKKP